MAHFLDVEPSLENHWRALILFGRNVASYKFALGKSLLELHASPGDLVRLEDLAVPFARHVREHLRLAPKQATSASSRFLEACRKANAGEMTEDELRRVTVALGFQNVIDAFHRLGAADLPRRFFVDERRSHGGIRLTDELRRLGEQANPADLASETEARWRLVETAWELDLSRSLVGFDPTSQDLTVVRRDRRTAVTSARAALNGYQKGHCFYCFAPIALSDTFEDTDVDHFFPWALRASLAGDVNGVWNLVLACRGCNRGQHGKSDLVPTLPLLERLHTRNEFLITSHHPLRETLMHQTGPTEETRRDFLQRNLAAAVQTRGARWAPALRSRPVL